MIILYFPPITANSPIIQGQLSTNPLMAASTPSSSTPTTPSPSQPPETATRSNGGAAPSSTQGSDNIIEQKQNDSGNDVDNSASKGNKGVVVAVVIVLLLLIGAGVAVAIVVLVLYLRKRDKSLTSCFKGRGSGLFGIGELIGL